MNHIQIVDKLRSQNPVGFEGIVDFLLSHFHFNARGYRRVRSDLPQCALIRQDPRELASLLVFIRERKIRSYVEVGVQFGACYYLVDSFLRANGDFEWSCAVDVADRTDGMNEYLAKNSAAEFRLCTAEQPACFERPCDLVFIDTNEQVKKMRAYRELYGPDKCRYLAFHDSRDTRWGASQLKYDHEFWVAPKGPGIGVIDWSQHTLSSTPGSD